MTVKVNNSRYLNLELEKKYKEKEEKLLEQAKCKLKQLKSSKFQNNLNWQKNVSKRPDNLKSNCSRVQGLNKCKLIASLPSPEIENTRGVNGVSNRTNLINGNIVLDSDSGVSSSLDKSYTKKNDNINQLQELKRPCCENSYFCCDNSVSKRCGCFNYTALFANLTNNDSFELFRSFKMGSLEYEQKLHEKIRILEQQEKILNNRLILPKTINNTRFTAEDGKPISSIHNYSDNQIKKESLASERENKGSSSKNDHMIASNLSTNPNSGEKSRDGANNKFADDLFISKVTERIVNNIKKDIFHVGSVEKQSKILQTDQLVEFKSPPSVEMKSEMCQTSAIMISSVRSLSKTSNSSSTRSSKCSNENPRDDINGNTVLSNKTKYKSERNNKQLPVEYEDKAVNTDRQYIQQRHTRHKTTCKRVCRKEEKRKSPRTEHATGMTISNSCSSESNSEDQPVTSEHHYKAIQVVVNVHADRGKLAKHKSSSYVTEIPTKSCQLKGTTSNWRRLLNEAEDKLTESSYYSPPDMVGYSRPKRISFPDNDKTAVTEPAKWPKHKKKMLKIDNKTLRMYVEKVLSMRRDSIDKLDVSSCSTPSEISLIFDENKDDYRLTEERAKDDGAIIDKPFIDNENIHRRLKCSGVSTEIRERSNSVPAIVKENVQHRQTSQPEMKLPSHLSDNLRLANRNKHTVISVNDEEMNKQLSNLNLSMTDFEQNLKALCDEFDEKLTQFVDDEGRGILPLGRNRLEQSDIVTSTNDLNLHTRLHRLLQIPLDDPVALKMISSDDESDKISLEGSSSLDELPSMSDLMKIGLIDKPFKYALDDVTTPSDTDIRKLLEIDSCYSKENNEDIISSNNNINNNDGNNNDDNKKNNEMIDALNSDRSKSTAVNSDRFGRDLLTLLSPTTATADLEQIIRQLGLSWMSTTLQKTKEASALVSSSSGGENTNQNYHLKNAANILLMNNNFKQDAELEQFAPVTAFFKNDEKLVSPIGNKSVKKHQVSAVSSSS